MRIPTIRWALGLILVSALVTAPVGAAERTKIADVAVGGAEAVWTPRVGGYDHIVLDVSGPGGVSLRSEFAEGMSPSLGLYDQAGAPLPDGVYKFELTLVPRVDAATRDRLSAAREQGEAAIAELRREGLIPQSISRQTGYFSILGGSFVSTDAREPESKGGAAGIGTSPPGDPVQTVITNSDGVIRNSLCVGFDCPDSPSFSDTTILLMENNTRIKFDDTSSIAGFPNRDWEIEANSASSGGQSYLGINDCATSSQGGCATDLVFAIEANVRSSALYVESDGDVGIGTSNPVLELHIVRGDSPGVRLEQDGSSGFAPQTWDVAGNETSFFIRDATNGSTLPFRIQPGASSNSVFIANGNNVGMGTTSPMSGLGAAAKGLHIVRTGTAEIILALQSSGPTTRFTLNNTNDTIGGGTWSVGARQNSNFIITRDGTGMDEFSLDRLGNLVVIGNCTEVDGACADYVFDKDYELMPLDELESYVKLNKHLPNVPSTADIKANGLNIQQFQGRLLEKIEELTLHTLEQQKKIDELETANRQLAEVQERLARLEAAAGSLQ
jgi:hypothetical protein